MLSSIGCPYHCAFCIAWDNPYQLMSRERLAEDLRFLAERLPKAEIAFHDPNFGVKFDPTLEVLESVPPDIRLPYLMEASLSILRGDRPRRPGETNCIGVAPGIESWTDYSNKAGAAGMHAQQKVVQTADHFRHLFEHVPYLQANFIFGLDSDAGHEPIDLTLDFMDRTPFVWPTFNIPVPFGGTPLYDELSRTGRIRETMPFIFYYAPYLVMTIRNYDPITYYEKLISLFAYSSAPRMLRRRVAGAPNRNVAALHIARTIGTRTDIRRYREILRMLRTDRSFRRFTEGEAVPLPTYYQAEFDRILGPDAAMLAPAERTPILEEPAEVAVVA